MNQRALLECQQQRGASQGANGHAWKWIYYANGTVIQYFAQSRACSVQTYAPFAQVFDEWTDSLTEEHNETVKGVNCTTYHLPDQTPDVLSLSVLYSVSKSGIPVRCVLQGGACVAIHACAACYICSFAELWEFTCTDQHDCASDLQQIMLR